MLLGLRRAARLPICARDSISLRSLRSSFFARFAAQAVLVRHPSTRTAFLMPPSLTPNPRNEDRPLSDEERPAKRVKLDPSVEEPVQADETQEDFLPPSSRLFQEKRVHTDRVLEQDVGIREYISRDLPPLQGIIKQRFTDFLVFEVDQSGQVLHVKDISKPPAPVKPVAPPPEEQEEPVADLVADGLWHPEFDEALTSFLAEDARKSLKQMYEEGVEPPFVSDSGWGNRAARAAEPADNPTESAPEPTSEPSSKRGRGRGRGRDNRGGGQGRVSGREKRPDNRKVVSESIESKEQRTALHTAIRNTFKSKLETETAEDNKIVIRWGHGMSRGGKQQRKGGPKLPPFVHFTMQKTNRDTHDALTHLSRMIKLPVRDFGVAGTKDKRGVTTQRVSLKTNGRSLETLWKNVNNVPARRTEDQAVTMRGERGIRAADFAYADAQLELGMLTGNAFVITLRNVKAESEEAIDHAMQSIKSSGFINYYGMQRFGTATVPTHAIGVALLKADWRRAVSLIMDPRPGDHPDVEAGRRAWSEEGDIEKALQLLPRRVVAERCILESFKKQGGDSRNFMQALNSIPRNLRMMYTHAYQSYVWNTVVSERIKRFGSTSPIVGDLVFAGDVSEASAAVDVLDVEDDMDVTEPAEEEPTEAVELAGSSNKKWKAPSVKVLTAEDIDKYSIFDVIMPLPGRDITYPGGELGDLYKTILKLDEVGIDHEQPSRISKDYLLLGSYRKIVQLPRDVSWSVMRYTDPDAALAQADEDVLIGMDVPTYEEDGKFIALQIRLTLPTAAYATMALREVTKTDTSSHHQAELTKQSEDQAFRQAPAVADAVASDSVAT